MEQVERYKLKPAAGRIVVRPGKVKDMLTESGIIIPALGDRTPTVGEVIEVCSDYEYDGEEYDPIYKVGDWVIFGKYSGTEITIGRDRVLLIDEKNILARLVDTQDPNAELEREVSIHARGSEEEL